MSAKLPVDEARGYRVQVMEYVKNHRLETSTEIIRGTGLPNKRVYALLNKFYQMGMLERSSVSGGKYFNAWAITTRGLTYLATGCQPMVLKSNAAVPEPEYRWVDNYENADRWWKQKPPARANDLNWGARV